MIIKFKSYTAEQGHKGRPGMVGGSMPAGDSGGVEGVTNAVAGKKMAKVEDLMSRVLTRSGFKIADAKHLTYRAHSNGLTLQDRGGWNGHMSTFLSADSLHKLGYDVPTFTKLLTDHGAVRTPNHKRESYASTSQYD